MSTDYSARDFRRKFEGIEEELPPSITAVARAAMTSAESVGETGFVAFNSQSLALEKDGCDFLAAIYFYLVKIGCPGLCCDFVAVVTALSDGDGERSFPLTDVFLAGVMNIHTRNIQRKRKALIEWMQKENYSVLGITEGEYDREKKKNKPTQYQAVLAPIAAQVVLDARTGNIWSEDPKAKTKALQAAAEEKVWQTPEAPPPVKKRKEKKVVPPEKEISRRRKAIITNFLKILRIQFKQGGDPTSMWEELRFDMDYACKEEVRIMTETGGVF